MYLLSYCSTPSPVLLPTLSNFLQTEPAPWFRSVISAALSRIPLRNDGVLQTIVFLASQFSPSLGENPEDQTSRGPHFTVQSIMQTSHLLSSVPQGMDAAAYFSSIAPQLLALLDGDDPDLKRTAAYVIGNGILGKRAYGAVGTIGHSIFVEPIFKVLTASLDDASKRWLQPLDCKEDGEPLHNLVDHSTLNVAIERLRSLVLQHSNPGLVKRVVYPVILPLWGLACFACDQDDRLHDTLMTILKTYFGISVGAQPLEKIADNLLYNGGVDWTYGLDSTSSVSLITRSAESEQHNLVQLIDALQLRVKLFASLLGADPNSEERTGDIFLHVSERWLVKRPIKESSLSELQFPSQGEGPNHILQSLVSAKLAESLLDNFKDTLSRRPLRVLILINQIINGELSRVNAQHDRLADRRDGKVSLSSLANIVSKDDREPDEGPAAGDSDESLPAVFSLLSTVLASPEFSVSPEILGTLESVKQNLDQLIPSLPQSLAKPATTASMLIEINLACPEGLDKEKSAPGTSDFETHRRALTNLNSDLPPVQAEGFSLLSDLITKGSPILDVPSTLTLLLSILTDSSETQANDEFVYLNAIKLVAVLASRHPRTVVKTLVDRYADRTENMTLDQRLKIGECLLRTVQDLGEALQGETAKILGEGSVAVAGRRARKPETQKTRRQQLEKEKRQQEREERQREKDTTMPDGWTVSSPALASDALMEDEDSESESPEKAAQAANIVAAWAAGASSDEEPDDLRIRASAMSILATAVQTNIAGLGPSIVASAVDLALSTLTLESEEGAAILRRASVVLLLDILKAIDTAREKRGSGALGFGFSLSDEPTTNRSSDRGPTTVGNLPYMLRVLQFVESHEMDAIVRGHVRALIESLEAWLEKSILWGIGAQGSEEESEPRLELGDQIAGLDINPLAGTSGAGRPRIEEIE